MKCVALVYTEKQINDDTMFLKMYLERSKSKREKARRRALNEVCEQQARVAVTLEGFTLLLHKEVPTPVPTPPKLRVSTEKLGESKDKLKIPELNWNSVQKCKVLVLSRSHLWKKGYIIYDQSEVKTEQMSVSDDLSHIRYTHSTERCAGDHDSTQGVR